MAVNNFKPLTCGLKFKLGAVQISTFMMTIIVRKYLIIHAVRLQIIHFIRKKTKRVYHKNVQTIKHNFNSTFNFNKQIELL